MTSKMECYIIQGMQRTLKNGNRRGEEKKSKKGKISSFLTSEWNIAVPEIRLFMSYQQIKFKKL